MRSRRPGSKTMTTMMIYCKKKKTEACDKENTVGPAYGVTSCKLPLGILYLFAQWVLASKERLDKGRAFFQKPRFRFDLFSGVFLFL